MHAQRQQQITQEFSSWVAVDVTLDVGQENLRSAWQGTAEPHLDRF